MWNNYSNKSETFLDELFLTPTSSFRGAPLWAWNTKLNKNQLLKQIECFKTMGMGGFFIHVRTGLQTEYLGKEYMDCVRMCVQKAKQLGMLCWLYDEDRWPSGTAGGLVTRDRKYRARYLVLTPQKRGDNYCGNASTFYNNQEQFRGYFIAKYHIVLKNGFLYEYRRLDNSEDVTDEENMWWAYLEIAEETSWYNHQTYVNTLDSEATQRFIQYTHEAYYNEVGEEFGVTIPAIFTDEPQFREKECLNCAEEKKDIIIPYTDDFDDTYFKQYDEHFLDSLPEVIWQLEGNQISKSRYRYHDHLCERFAKGYVDVIGKWCEEHNLMLTGHLMQEPYLSTQTQSVGEAMRLYRSFQLPGVDMLCNSREYTTVKQAQSVSHQYGRQGVLCEMYGVTNWDFSFKDHKLMGDWLAALGVTTRVHHLAWLSMAGERKRDYPASINYQSPWYTEYSYIEDYFSRINTVLTRGRPQVKIGVIHPIESYWLFWGPDEQTYDCRQEIENSFQAITEWLLSGLLDFDYISEALLSVLHVTSKEGAMTVGEMEYEVIVVPECVTLRENTIEYLEKYSDYGGKVIFAGNIAKYIDGVKSDRVEKLANRCTKIAFSQKAILDSLNDYRDVDIWGKKGKRHNNLIYQMRSEKDRNWLFICHMHSNSESHILNQIFNIEWEGKERITIKIKGHFSVKLYDAMNGRISDYPSQIVGRNTIIQTYFYSQDSLLFCLEPSESNRAFVKDTNDFLEEHMTECLVEPEMVWLSEPNVFLLDQAEYQLDNGDWNEEEEILRIDEKLRNRLGYSQRHYGKAQPWLEKAKEEAHLVRLRYRIISENEVADTLIALEYSENMKLTLNGSNVDLSTNVGYYVDESIKTFKLPLLRTGVNELIAELCFKDDTDLESMYLLGQFRVSVAGRKAGIYKSSKKVLFGNLGTQGYPFYSGNTTYECNYISDGARVTLCIPKWEGAVISVFVDGEKKGYIALEPNVIELGKLSVGTHRISITVFGNRFNTFGALHNCVENYRWFGPNAWRTHGTEWSYQYQLKDMGILSSPLIYKWRK